MPPSVNRALVGALRLFLAKPDAMQYFRTDYSGVWLSFGALIFVTVLGIAAWNWEIFTTLTDVSAWTKFRFVFETQALPLAVAYLPLLILTAFAAKVFQPPGSYSAFVVVYNWSSSVWLVLLPTFIAEVTFFLPDYVAPVLVISWYSLQSLIQGLRVTRRVALALVAAQVALILLVRINKRATAQWLLDAMSA